MLTDPSIVFPRLENVTHIVERASIAGIQTARVRSLVTIERNLHEPLASRAVSNKRVGMSYIASETRTREREFQRNSKIQSKASAKDSTTIDTWMQHTVQRVGRRRRHASTVDFSLCTTRT